MKDILLKLITFLHVIFVLFVVVTPFTNSNYFLFVHAIFIPFLLLHWILNNNTCMLTIVERKLRKELGKNTDENDCFTCKLIEPIYDFSKNYKTFSIIIYTITILLWLISLGKLVWKYKNNQITSYKDLFKI